MKQHFWKRQLPVFVLAGTLLTTTIAWKEHQSAPAKWTGRDTVPHKEQKVKDFDDVRRELQRAEQELERALKELKVPEPPTPPVAPEKIREDVEKSLQELSPQKLKAALDQAFKDIDVEKMKADVAASLKGVEADKTRAQADAAVARLDAEKMKKELEAAVAKIDAGKMKAEIKQLNEEHLKKLEKELQELKPRIEAELKKARTGMDKAKQELQEYENFINHLAGDGLLKKDGYTVEHKEGQLIINGVVQPAEVHNKYRSFLEKHKNLLIKKNAGTFTIQKKQQDKE